VLKKQNARGGKKNGVFFYKTPEQTAMRSRFSTL